MSQTTLDPRPFEVRYIDNPTQSELRSLTLEHTPSVVESSVGSVNKISRNKSRVAKYTYIIATPDQQGHWSGGTILPDKGERIVFNKAKIKIVYSERQVVVFFVCLQIVKMHGSVSPVLFHCGCEIAIVTDLHFCCIRPGS